MTSLYDDDDDDDGEEKKFITRMKRTNGFRD